VKNKKLIIGLVVIAVFSAFAFYSFRSALNPYVTFAEAARTQGKVQVSGELVQDEIQYDLESGELAFYLVDEEGSRMPVRYQGAKPANMEHSESAVVIGTMERDIFHAERLLVKCPSRYEEEQ